MIRTIIALAAVLTALLASSPAAAIIDGEPDSQHPYVGALIADVPGYGPAPVCSGTLISPTAYVTAAHCVTDGGMKLLGLSFAQTPLTDPRILPPLVPIAEIHVHPDFVPSDIFADVAVIVTASPVTLSGYATLPGREALASMLGGKSAFTVVGYGWEQFLPTSSGLGTRRYTTTRLLGLEYPKKKDHSPGSSALKLTKSQGGGGGVCYSDSGGPNFPENSAVLAGITVGVTKNCTGLYWALRLDTEPILSFVAQYG